MAISHGTEWLDRLQLVVKKAKKLNKKVLFSETIKLDYMKPLSFYQEGRDKYAGDRFFWQDPDQDIILAGLGKVDTLQTDADSTRFLKMESEWRSLLDQAVIHGVTGVPGTGPLLFGGFSFDEQKSDSLLWDQFGDHMFYMPKFMLSIVKGQAYLTTNLICSPQDQVQLFENMINEREEAISQKGKNTSFSGNDIEEIREIAPDEWKMSVAQAVEEIKTSELDKIVLAREIRVLCKNPILSEDLLEALTVQQPTNYIYCLEAGSDCFIGASPERLVKKTGTELLSTCLAGSIARGKDEAEDERLGSELLDDPKNLIEHQYVVSMIKQAMKSVCTELDIPAEPVLMKNRHIQHLYTPVRGKSSMDISIFRLVDKLHPTPALGGLPKEKAVIRIRDLERLERGMYGGPLGWIDSEGNGEFIVALRSALIQGKEASLFAGCGIVEDSVPESEFEETRIKFKPMLTALGGEFNE